MPAPDPTDPATGTRDEPFSYACRLCQRCCHNKLIRLNPYEIARLAANQGQTTADFQAASTTTLDGLGPVLRQTEADGACVFLGEGGCTVHADRPLACRLYPLGRKVSEDGVETWVHTDPHPQTEGEYGTAGRIADFIAGQDTALYIQATDSYAAWVRRAVRLVTSSVQGDHEIPLPDLAGLLDPDTAIAAYAARTGQPEPEGVEARIQLHLAILREQLSSYENATPQEQTP